MNQKEVNRLSFSERSQALHQVLKEVNSALNLYGPDKSPVVELAQAYTEQEVDQAVAVLLQHECNHKRGSCHHSFPLWYIKEAQPIVRRAQRLAKQILRAP